MKAILPYLAAILLPGALHAQGIYEVAPLEMRTHGEDYSPVLLDSGFVMCSVRDVGGMVDYRDADTQKPLSDLYWVPLRDGVSGTPILFSEALASPVNEGPADFSDNGNTICFTRNIVPFKKVSSNRLGTGELGLFLSTRSADSWSEPESFPYNSTKYSILHPSFSKDGTELFFASDMPGGLGGMDLYKSERTATGWGEPINLGASINTAANEVFPRIHREGELYFSSDRSGGMGKLDIYHTYRESGNWSGPVVLPEPVNSAGNDLGFMLMDDGKNALFSSDRSGVDRIQIAKWTVPKFRACTEQRPNNFCYRLKSKPHAATASLPLEHAWDMGDGTTIKGLEANHCYQAPGSYIVRSMLMDQKTGSVFYVLRTNELLVEEAEQAYIATPDTVRTGRNLVLDARLSNLPDLEMNEYHWDLGDGQNQQGTKIQHQFRTAGTYEVRLDILGGRETDGTIRNFCSTKRIVVIDRYREQEEQGVLAVYQDALGVERSFEFQELPSDEFAMLSQDLSDGRFSVELFASKERLSLDDPKFAAIRKHYPVVERFDPVRAAFTYSVGETSDVQELYEIYRKVKELQFLESEVFALEVEKVMDLSNLGNASLDELNKSKLSTTAIHFAFKSAAIEPEAGSILSTIQATLQQHPELSLVIEAHTDDIGSRSYNLDLSQQRANAVVMHLSGSGIDPERLVAIGHGKNQPVADNATEAGRSQNRRVEFRMVVEQEAEAYQRRR
jgi:outer membrane protein OmpA-like peptidoglycan-associated protein